MKIFLPALAVILMATSCKTAKTADNNLPKDAATKPEHTGSQHADSEAMKALRAEIDAAIAKTPCTDASQWRISPIGSKSCGGPAAYIAYPIKIEDDLMPKIKEYTAMQSAYNKRYRVMSDCSMVMPPSGVQCVDGKAQLVRSGSGKTIN